MEFNVDDLATLSRIRLSDDQKKALKEDLSKILEYVEQINELELTDVPITSHVLDAMDVFREDEVVEQPDIAKKVISHLKDSAKDNNFFRVPKVIEGIE